MTTATLPAEVERTRHGKYLTFTLDREDFGLEILTVREIIGMMPITRVPRMPDFVRGVINLRGKVIPVVDLRMKFGMPSVEETMETCIIVVDLGNLLTGIVVDRVSEVRDIRAQDIEDTPQFGVSVNTEFITGFGRIGDRVAILLDIRKALTEQDLTALAHAGD